MWRYDASAGLVTRSHWMPISGECIHCFAPVVVADMVTKSERKTQNHNKTQLLAGMVQAWVGQILLTA